MRPLTSRQQSVLEFVCEFSRQKGFSPSLREIGEAIGLSNVSAVRGHVAALERKGYLSKEPDQPRSINVLRVPSLMSRLKRRLHAFARTDEGVLHRVRYGIVLVAREPFPAADAWLDESVEHLHTEHGWTVLQRKSQTDHLVLVVEVWPNHSPELTARRIRATTENALRRHGVLADSPVWVQGYAVTTELDQLDEIVTQFLASTGRTGPGGANTCDSF